MDGANDLGFGLALGVGAAAILAIAAALAFVRWLADYFGRKL